MLVKPSDRLEERLLLGKPLHGVGYVAAHREPVLHAREDVDLPRPAAPAQDLLRLDALVEREDVVGLRGSDGEGPGDGYELLLGDE